MAKYILLTHLLLVFSYLFSGLDDNTSYKIEVSGVTVNGMTFTTGIISFTVDYSPVYVGLLD